MAKKRMATLTRKLRIKRTQLENSEERLEELLEVVHSLEAKKDEVYAAGEKALNKKGDRIMALRAEVTKAEGVYNALRGRNEERVEKAEMRETKARQRLESEEQKHADVESDIEAINEQIEALDVD